MAEGAVSTVKMEGSGWSNDTALTGQNFLRSAPRATNTHNHRTHDASTCGGACRTRAVPLLAAGCCCGGNERGERIVKRESQLQGQHAPYLYGT